MEWKRQDTMTPKEREEYKRKFIKSLLNDKKCMWRYVSLNNMDLDYLISWDGRLVSTRMCREMTPHKNSDGYLETILSENKKRMNVSIHRLVAQAFIPNPNNLPEVNHKDGNKENNCYWNLEWVTKKRNIEHSIETGLRDKYVHRNLYTEKQIKDACRLLSNGDSIASVYRTTGVSKRILRNIKNGKGYQNKFKLYLKDNIV